MESFLLYFLKINVYLTLLVITHQFLLRRYKNFRFSRPYLQLGITFSLILPLFSLKSLNQFGDYIVINNLLSEVIIYGQPETSALGLNWNFILLISYLVGVSFFSIRLLANLFNLFRLKFKSPRQVNYFLIHNSSAAFSFMNWIFIGDEIPEREREIIISHEKVHAEKKHSIDLLVCHLLEVFCWINPFIFQLKKHFDEVHEFEADELSCNHQEDYLNLLVKQSFSHYTIPVHQFNSNHLKQRIMRIKNKKSKRVNPKSLATALLAFALLFFINQNLNSSEIESFELLSANTKGEVDKVAQFPGGQEAMVKFIMKNTVYPKNLIENNIEGTVYVKFKINANGELSDIEVANKDAHPELQRLGLETIAKMPNWEPAIKDGKKVASVMTLPIKFLPPPPPPPAPEAPNAKPPKAPKPPKTPKG